jgi:hypothetical protein
MGVNRALDHYQKSRGALLSWSVSPSFVAQGFHGLHLGGGTRWDDAGRKRGDRQESDDGYEHGRAGHAEAFGFARERGAGKLSDSRE